MRGTGAAEGIVARNAGGRAGLAGRPCAGEVWSAQGVRRQEWRALPTVGLQQR